MVKFKRHLVCQGITMEACELQDFEKSMKEAKQLFKKAEGLLNQHLSTCIISTADQKGNLNVAIVNSAQFVDDTTLESLYTAETTTVSNLRENPLGVFSVIFPSEANIWKTEGIRIWVELEREETEGHEFEALAKQYLEKKVLKPKGRLVFRVHQIKPLRHFEL